MIDMLHEKLMKQPQLPKEGKLTAIYLVMRGL